MRIVRPYGRSFVDHDPGGALQRKVELRAPVSAEGGPRQLDLGHFALTHDELVIAQWVSCIDKIATKPREGREPSGDQREFRHHLGNAAWGHLETHGLLSGLRDPQKRARLAKLWQMKIAPYDFSARTRRSRGPQGVDAPAKGRWFGVFAGDVSVQEADCGAIVARIHEHLYESQYRLGEETPLRSAGLIARRAGAITTSVAPDAAKPSVATWSEADLARYRSAGDVACKIRRAAREREQGRDGAGTRRVTNSVAGKVLFDHWRALFSDEGGTVRSFRDVEGHDPGLAALHNAVRECYARILKRHKKKPPGRDAGPESSAILRALPRDMDALLTRIDSGRRNRDLAAKVRLGKLIHYTASDPAHDRAGAVAERWPGDVADSRYRTSAGQAEIKRNEAFVRVWRHVLVLAARTLENWADPENRINRDILSSGGAKAACEQFESSRFMHKCNVLFGERAGHFIGQDDAALQKAVLELALERLGQLRNRSFHFTGRGGFLEVLQQLGQPAEKAPCQSAHDRTMASLRALWRDDDEGRGGRLKATMTGAHFETFLDEAQIRRFFDQVSTGQEAEPPLPRFGRVLQRAKNTRDAQSDLRPHLPDPGNMRTLEDPARLCQYTALKLLYAKPFRTWLAEADSAVINPFIEAAVTRARREAQKIWAARTGHHGVDEEAKALIQPRMAMIGRLAPGENIQTLFFRMSAETATEMRVQAGYESDPDAAREQAEFIENLKCDVIAQAFMRFLDEAGFDFLLTLDARAARPESARFDLAMLDAAARAEEPQDWMLVLYFLLHLVPVDEAGRLLHQLRKWEILAGPEEAGARTGADAANSTLSGLYQVLDLYLDMHDAKFSGGAALYGARHFRNLFEDEADFDRLFPVADAGEEDKRIPLRGLREILRFGDRATLEAIYAQNRIRPAEVAEVLDLEAPDADGMSRIAGHHARREKLHAQWVEAKQSFDDDAVRDYFVALGQVVRHRHLAARARLVDHVRLHRLMMNVLGRLADFAGLWERDVYFVMLATLYEQGTSPAAVLNCEARRKLSQGRIVEVIRALKPVDGGALYAAITGHFPGFDTRRNDDPVQLRNNFAHFNMLRQGHMPDLTACVNRARRLMAYDRKLKNAVSKAVIELLAREGLTLSWRMDARGPQHDLTEARITARTATHLGGIRLTQRGGSTGSRPFPLTEALHGTGFARMVAQLFAGQDRPSRCVSQDDPTTIERAPARNTNRKESAKKRMKPGRDGGRRHEKSRRG